MRFRTLEIRWHDSKPISTCDFQPAPFKKARPPAGQEKNFAAHAYRLATGGEDNHVRLWMVHPNIRPTALLEESDSAAVGAPRPPRVEYLATLSRHSAAVNVVRFSPNGMFFFILGPLSLHWHAHVECCTSGDLIASAGDDGMIIIWAPSTSPQASTYGSDLSPDELQYEKEYWKPRTTFRCTTMQVYDLAWSPTGEYIIAGSTDNTARVFAAVDGKCVCEIAEHTHFVQGVAWDPLNEYIATQSSDRSMHIYRISTKNGVFEAHAVGRNTRMPNKHSRTPSVHGHNSAAASNGTGARPQSTSRPPVPRRESNSAISDAESASSHPESRDKDKEKEKETDVFGALPLTPATSVASTPSTALSASMFPPPPLVPSSSSSAAPSVVGNNPSSRRSSFSGSNAPSSPQVHPHSYGRYGRSPSPMPPLPAIRTPLTLPVGSMRLYGDESYTNFFRRLNFSPDGGLLLTPAGQFDDPTVVVVPQSTKEESDVATTTPMRGRKGRAQPTTTTQTGAAQQTSAQTGSNSCVYIYSRANFARPPIAQLPAQKKASVVVKFSPVLYELRSGVVGPSASSGESKGNVDDAKTHVHGGGKAKAVGVIEKSIEGVVEVDVVGLNQHGERSPTPTPRSHDTQGGHESAVVASPTLSSQDRKPPTPIASKPSTPVPSTSASNTGPASASATVATPTTGSIFALPYRMLFAVVTMDTVTIYDTQQASPICLLTKLHYDEFTDMSWSPDGQSLMLSSRDGYCTLVIFDEIIPAHHTQQHALQLQSIAHNLSAPHSLSSSSTSLQVSSASHHGQQLHSPVVTPVSVTLSSTSSGGVVSHPPPFVTLSSVPKKRAGVEPPLTPALSTDGSDLGSATGAGTSSGSASQVAPGTTPGAQAATAAETAADDTKGSGSADDKTAGPPKKKRRVQLTRVGDLGS
ncbi:hypothetical protein AMATHDRAFT_49126 [Amanita thiersii Skay4041]|uniref:CAF1B/HIR1 beta-propeller domain-containing protein n=1 Tax=Amanita thiersii Skay4041 TaxID=703135 RepID=A0A2A9NMI5_9AGAR|nr:hypothetical protein AMATHDRAFT_49126 [Amanita thiersii Skay4041]